MRIVTLVYSLDGKRNNFHLRNALESGVLKRVEANIRKAFDLVHLVC
jgi:hypothetical protein